MAQSPHCEPSRTAPRGVPLPLLRVNHGFAMAAILRYHAHATMPAQNAMRYVKDFLTTKRTHVLAPQRQLRYANDETCAKGTIEEVILF